MAPKSPSFPFRFVPGWLSSGVSIQDELQNPAPAKLVVQSVSKWFKAESGRVHALDDITLSIAEGEFVCIVGPSGCGKSTLLNLIAGLDVPDQGQILSDGQPVTGPGRERMMMFQEHALFPWLDVLGNVLYGLKLKPHLARAERLEVARYYLHLVGLASNEKSSIHELSGGMKQRVALARALAPNPRVLLMDEPFAALDALTRERLYEDLQKIWQVRRKTILFVTHNVREAACLGDRVLLFAPNPGRLQAEFPIDLPRPRDLNMPQLPAYSGRIMAALKDGLLPEMGAAASRPAS